MMDRIVFHFNKASIGNPTIPPWVVKSRGETHYVWHVASEIGFDTKETPDNPHTQGSIQFRGRLRLVEEDGRLIARIDRLGQDITELIALAAEARRIMETDADWEVKYNVIFNQIRMAQRVCMPELRWYDPDTSYEADVRAYVTALEDYAERYMKVLP